VNIDASKMNKKFDENDGIAVVRNFLMHCKDKRPRPINNLRRENNI
jgi:hypothetical protein